MLEWESLSSTPWKRKYTFLPTRHTSLRHVPAYPRYTRERFLRCLDLYLAPRAIKMRLTISADELVPRLPSPRDLQPFPTSEALVFKGHTALVRSADFDPTGQYIVSGSDDCTVKETQSGRCLRTIQLGESVSRVSWIPVLGLSLVAVGVGTRVLLLNPGADIGCHRVVTATDLLLEEPPPKHDVNMDSRTASCVTWDVVTPDEWARGIRLAITHFKPVTHVCWHARGDYIAVTLRDGASRSVVVHQVSRRRSQLPFSRAKGLVQAAIFHPTKPILFVAERTASPVPPATAPVRPAPATAPAPEGPVSAGQCSRLAESTPDLVLDLPLRATPPTSSPATTAPPSDPPLEPPAPPSPSPCPGTDPAPPAIDAADTFAHNRDTLKKRPHKSPSPSPSCASGGVGVAVAGGGEGGGGGGGGSPVPARNTARVCAKFAELTLTGGSLKPALAAKPALLRRPAPPLVPPVPPLAPTEPH